MPEEKNVKENPGQEPEKKAPAAPVEEDNEPIIRRSAKDYIIARKQRKIEKLENQNADDNFDDFGDNGEEITPEGRQAIHQEIEPLTKRIKETADRQELKDAISKYPEAKGMEKVAWKHMKAYPNTAAEFIVLGLIGKKRVLDEKKRKANEEAKGNTIEGTSRRPRKEAGKIPDVTNMSDEEFKKLDNDVLSGKYLPK